MRKILLILLVIPVLALSGCADVDYIVTINRDNSALVRMIVKMEKTMSIEELEAYINENFYRNLESGKRKIVDFTYKLYETDSHYIFEVISNENNNSRLNAVHFGALWDIVSPGEGDGYTGITMPFYREYSFLGKVKIPESAAEGYLSRRHIPNDVNIRVTVDLPTEVKSTNADLIFNNKKTLLWEIDPKKDAAINFSYAINDLYKPVIFLLSLFALFALKLRKYK